MKLYRTQRGFARADFKDANGQACSIQDSSVATDDMLWLGCDKGEHVQGECLARMHLTRKQAAALVPLLTRFADTGTIDQPLDSP
jgi:hypothetical protein